MSFVNRCSTRPDQGLCWQSHTSLWLPPCLNPGQLHCHDNSSGKHQMKRQILGFVSYVMVGVQVDEPHTRASIIAEAAKNNHAWIPPSTGGNFTSSYASDLDLSSHGDSFVSSQVPESPEKEVLRSIDCIQLEHQRLQGNKFASIFRICRPAGLFSNEKSRAQCHITKSPQSGSKQQEGMNGRVYC